MALVRNAVALAAVLTLTLLFQGAVGTTILSNSTSIAHTAATTAAAAIDSTRTASASLPRRFLLGVPPCTLGYIPGCIEPTRTVFGNIVNGGGATVFLHGTPLRGTALPGSYNLSTVALLNGDYEFIGIYRGTYDIVPANQAGFTFTPSSVKVEIAGADARAPSMTRTP
jgi:hypothetical protein